jgi:hypothetical protein
MPKSAQIRKEDLRRAVRAYLYDRIGTALSTESICRGLKREWDATENEIRQALHFFKDSASPQIDANEDGCGATLYYRITSEGVLAHERGH